MTPTVADEIERYLGTGQSDIHHFAWPGRTLVERAEAGQRDLRGALVGEVLARTAAAWPPPVPSPADIIAVTRRKVEPMVRGLLPRAEQDIVLTLVERSVVLLTPQTITDVLTTERWDRTAWDVANLYLASVGAPLLGPDAPRIVGLSQETTCFLTSAYFAEDEPFADFLVHEVAHIFHNHKRRRAGLRATRHREWLLPVAFQKRETFAYSCEGYARVVERAPKLADRPPLASTFDGFSTTDGDVDACEVAEIVREAARHRKGWKVILARCGPDRAPPAPSVSDLGRE